MFLLVFLLCLVLGALSGLVGGAVVGAAILLGWATVRRLRQRDEFGQTLERLTAAGRRIPFDRPEHPNCRCELPGSSAPGIAAPAAREGADSYRRYQPRNLEGPLEERLEDAKPRRQVRDGQVLTLDELPPIDQAAILEARHGDPTL